MLLLTRRTNESIVIGDSEATITVLSITDGRVRLGIDAPKSISVHRKEIYLKVKGEALGHIRPYQLSQSREHGAAN